ncbi:MAG: hypothetical protein WKG07_35985 [Hymenobacter sp.]
MLELVRGQELPEEGDQRRLLLVAERREQRLPVATGTGATPSTMATPSTSQLDEQGPAVPGILTRRTRPAPGRRGDGSSPRRCASARGRAASGRGDGAAAAPGRLAGRPINDGGCLATFATPRQRRQRPGRATCATSRA